MKKQSAYALVAMTALILMFQNCGKVSYSAIPANGSLVASTTPDNGNTISVTDPGIVNVPAPAPSASPAPALPVPGDKHVVHAGEGEDSDSDHDGKNCKDPKHPDDGEESKQVVDGPHDFICVLQGAGESTKLAFQSKELVGQVGTPDDVCMSENACLNIVSKGFEVKGAVQRGFCPNKNPHVLDLTDDEISKLISAKLESK
jgi:hypothetical protein